jgi:tetratricopeptide (TPR) repeat protein
MPIYLWIPGIFLLVGITVFFSIRIWLNRKSVEHFKNPVGHFIKHPENIFNLKPNLIIYVEDECNAVVNDYFTHHYDAVTTIFAEINKASHLNLELLYLPRILDELKNSNDLQSVLAYYFPGVEMQQDHALESSILSFKTATFTRLLFDTLNYQEEVQPGFLRIKKDRDNETNAYIYSYATINPADGEEFKKILQFYLSRVGDVEDRVYYQLVSEKSYLKNGQTYELSDFKFNYDAHKVAREIKEKIDLLKHSGSQHLLLNILGQHLADVQNTPNTTNNGLSRLVIEKDFRIILPDYHNLEIEMTPLPKAVFLFFLMHPEGVLLKHLCDHKTELLEMYKQLSYRETWDEMVRSIDELVDPTKNSINEKCSRIKESFIRNFDDRLARFYYITGARGKEKTIILNRELVIWNIDHSLLPVPTRAKSVESGVEIENQVQTLYNKGKEQLNEAHYAEAIELFTEVLEINKYHFNACSMRALAHFDTGDYNQAILDNNRAIELNPAISVAHHNRAEARLMQKHYAGALEDINLYLQQADNRCAPSYFMRGLIKMEMNDLRGACQDWFTAKHLGHPEADLYLMKYPKIKTKRPLIETMTA